MTWVLFVLQHPIHCQVMTLHSTEMSPDSVVSCLSAHIFSLYWKDGNCHDCDTWFWCVSCCFISQATLWLTSGGGQSIPNEFGLLPIVASLKIKFKNSFSAVHNQNTDFTLTIFKILQECEKIVQVLSEKICVHSFIF